MPELPEVEVVRAGLEPAVAGALVTAVHVLDERALTRYPPGGAAFEQALNGRRMTGAARRGKFLWLPLDGVGEGSAHEDSAHEDSAQQAMVAHLGMSGQLLLRHPSAPPERHERVRLSIEHPEHGELAIVFADQRTFGSLAIDTLVPTPDAEAGGWGTDLAAVPGQVAHIARDPLDTAFDDERLRSVLARKDSAIKRVLLDQTVLSGVGNIYADEALWAARIHPETRASLLSGRAVNRLLGEVRAVLLKALAEGGTSFDAQYVNVNGEAGYFAHSLNAYGRAGLPCPRCGHPITRVTFMNRSSQYCSRCQRPARSSSATRPNSAPDGSPSPR